MRASKLEEAIWDSRSKSDEQVELEAARAAYLAGELAKQSGRKPNCPPWIAPRFVSLWRDGYNGREFAYVPSARPAIRLNRTSGRDKVKVWTSAILTEDQMSDLNQGWERGSGREPVKVA